MLRQISIEELQHIQLEMLKVIASICDQHNLRYYLSSGTLLGAVRHQGPIPWDDDLDIQMPRPDYEQLIYILHTNSLPSHLEYACLDDRKHILPFLKIYYKESVVIERKLKEPFNKTKIWIDVFPIDGLPSHFLFLQLTFRISKFLRNALYTSIVDYKKLEGAQKIGTLILSPITRFIGARNIAKMLNWYSQRIRFDSATMIGQLVWGEHRGEAMNKTDYLLVGDLPYMDYQFHCPQFFDEHLTNLFGDYMIPPPEGKRVAHSEGEYFLKDEII